MKGIRTPMTKLTDSASRIASSSDVGKRFYDIFLSSYPQFREFFASTDMRQQRKMLVNALILIEAYHRTKGERHRQYLRFLGTVHQQLGVEPVEYRLWRDSMLLALEKFHGDEWSARLAREWQSAMDEAIEVILSAYVAPGEAQGRCLPNAQAPLWNSQSFGSSEPNAGNLNA